MSVHVEVNEAARERRVAEHGRKLWRRREAARAASMNGGPRRTRAASTITRRFEAADAAWVAFAGSHAEIAKEVTQ